MLTIDFSLLLGIPIGILTSLIVWWIVSNLLVSKIVFCDKICRMPAHSEKITRHVMMVENIGKRRMIDIEIKAMLTIPGLFNDLPHIKQEVYINTTFNKLLKIEPNKINKVSKKIENKLMFRLLPNRSYEFNRNIYPQEIRDKFTKGTLTIDDIFDINNFVKLNILILGYDEFSGSKRLFISQDYYKKDIVTGYFDENSIKVII